MAGDRSPVRLCAPLHYGRVRRQFVWDGPGTIAAQSDWRALIETRHIDRSALARSYSDVIGDVVYTRSGGPEFRRFRVFSSTVGLQLIADLGHCEVVHPLNYLIIRFLQDDIALGDPTLSAYLVAAMDELHETLCADTDACLEEQRVFCLLAVILLRLRHGDPESSIRELAVRLIAEEAASPEWLRDGNRFMLGVTNYDTFHDAWTAEILRAIPSDCKVEELAAALGGLQEESLKERPTRLLQSGNLP